MPRTPCGRALHPRGAICTDLNIADLARSLRLPRGVPSCTRQPPAGILAGTCQERVDCIHIGLAQVLVRH